MANVQHRAKIDADGNILGFYPSDIFPVAPAGCVDLTEDQYGKILAGQADAPNLFYKIVNGDLVDAPPPAPPAPQKNGN